MSEFLTLDVLDPPNGQYEKIEVVWLKDSRELDESSTPAIRLTWSQGPSLFGLLAPIDTRSGSRPTVDV